MNVLQNWLSDLTLRQQTVLLAAVRGPDGVDKNDISRRLVRALRATILRDACPGNGFMEEDWPTQAELRRDFLKRPDAYPLHWLVHFMHAAEVVAYEHPTEAVNMRWRFVYYDLCEALHVNPESREQMRARLQDGGERGCWKS